MQASLPSGSARIQNARRCPVGHERPTGGERGGDALLSDVVRDGDVDVDAVALGAGSSICWNQNAGPRP